MRARTMFLPANAAPSWPSDEPRTDVSIFVNGSSDEVTLVWARAWPRGSSASRSAARELASVAKAAALFARPRVRTEVVGDGVLAHLVRRCVGGEARNATPDVMVDTTGVAHHIAAATERVATLGTVLLAAPCSAPDVMLKTYSDLHVRGITLAGLRWDATLPEPDSDLVEWALQRIDAPGPDGRLLWYRVDR